MNTSMKWALGILVTGLMVGVGWSFGGQEAKKHEAPKDAKKVEQRQKAHAERMAKLSQALSNSKVSLSQALATAESETKGKAFNVEAELDKNNKLFIEVELFAKEKIVSAVIDPETGKVVKTSEEKPEDDGDDDDDEEDDD